MGDRDDTYEEFRVFVGGLSWNTDDRGLEDAFSKYGDVADAKVCSVLSSFNCSLAAPEAFAAW